MNYTTNLLNYFRWNKDIRFTRLTTISESKYKKLLNTEIRRLTIDYGTIELMDCLASKYGKLNCEICTLLCGNPDNLCILNLHEMGKYINYRDIGRISLDCINTKVIDLRFDVNKSNVIQVDIKANAYIGCRPINHDGNAILLERPSNGDIIVDSEGNQIDLFDVPNLLNNVRFAKTKSAKN
jgi:hypothetical protein